MKILVLASLAESLINFRGPLLKAMVAAGHEVHCAAPGLVPGSDAGERLKILGVGIVDIPLSRTGLNPLSDLRLVLTLWRLCWREKYDVVLGYTIKPVIWGMLAASFAGVPRRVALITGLGYAFTGTASGKRAIIQRIAWGLYALALRRAHLIFFQNPDDPAEMARHGILPADVPVEIVNGSGVDVAQFPRADLPAGPLQFLLIARLLADKGIREYVAAARLLRKNWPGAKFHLVGGTDSNPAGIAEAEVKAWHAEGDVIWHGHLSDVRPLLAQTHVYVLPSYREGTPRTVLEAMATGRAVITTDAPGCRQTVAEGETGFLVPVRDAQALAAAMTRFLKEPALIERFGAAGRQRAEEVFDVTHVNAQMLQAMGLVD